MERYYMPVSSPFLTPLSSTPATYPPYLPTCPVTNTYANSTLSPTHKFGMGSRTCIGKHVSILEMSKLIPRLIRNFDFELAESLQGPNARWKTSNYWFVKAKDFRVKVTARKSHT